MTCCQQDRGEAVGLTGALADPFDEIVARAGGRQPVDDGKVYVVLGDRLLGGFDVGASIQKLGAEPGDDRYQDRHAHRRLVDQQDGGAFQVEADAGLGVEGQDPSSRRGETAGPARPYARPRSTFEVFLPRIDPLSAIGRP
jgi:hypothetical protein